jgi:hypothetical protein
LAEQEAEYLINRLFQSLEAEQQLVDDLRPVETSKQYIVANPCCERHHHHHHHHNNSSSRHPHPPHQGVMSTFHKWATMLRKKAHC